MDQDRTRTLARDAKQLAREVGAQAVNRGCLLEDHEDPGVAELTLEAIRLRIFKEDVLQGVG
jgi:hypothetical protein